MTPIPSFMEALASTVTGKPSQTDALPSPPKPKGVSLVARAKDGDSQALDQLIRTHSPGIYRFVFRMVRHEQDARDITQEVFLRMVRSFHRYDPTYRFETWLYRIARNLCYDRGRKTKRWKFAFWSREEEERGTDPIQTLADPTESVLDRSLRKETGKQVEAAIDQLNAPYKEILLLYHFEELSYQEISSVLEIPMGTVMNRLYRARQSLKKVILAS